MASSLGEFIDDQKRGIETAKNKPPVTTQYGNMLSPSIMFVLSRIRAKHMRGEERYHRGIGFSFSPGVGAEGALFEVIQ